MRLKEFKTWFSGFAVGIGNSGLTAPQFAELKKKIEELEDGGGPKQGSSGPASTPATSPSDSLKDFAEKLRKALEEADKRYPDSPYPQKVFPGNYPYDWTRDILIGDGMPWLPGTIICSVTQ